MIDFHVCLLSCDTCITFTMLGQWSLNWDDMKKRTINAGRALWGPKKTKGETHGHSCGNVRAVECNGPYAKLCKGSESRENFDAVPSNDKGKFILGHFENISTGAQSEPKVLNKCGNGGVSNSCSSSNQGHISEAPHGQERTMMKISLPSDNEREYLSEPNDPFTLEQNPGPQQVQAECSTEAGDTLEPTKSGGPLPQDLLDKIFGRLPFRNVIQVLSVNKVCKDLIKRGTFLESRAGNGSLDGEFSPMYFTVDEKSKCWQWFGYNTLSKEWSKLPSLNGLPSPDPELFKDYLVAGAGGLLCVNVGKGPNEEELVVYNPLTQERKELPRLKNRRHPVLMHMQMVEHGNYKVIVAGSATIGSEHLSRKTEEYDSRTGEWIETGDLPEPEFGLNEYQNGVYYNDFESLELLLCVAVLDTRGKGILVYDLKEKKWKKGPNIPPVRSEPHVSHLATTEIVNCGGSAYVFSEQESGKDVYFCLHKLNPAGQGEDMWNEILKHKKTGGRGLLVYPEFTSVPVSAHELCIFNTVEHTMDFIDLNKTSEIALLRQSPTPYSDGIRFHSLNPLGFVFRPSFHDKV